MVDPEGEERRQVGLRYWVEYYSRQQLEMAGCPPCYPTGLQYPFNDVPPPYKNIIDYWRLGPPSTDCPLNAQSTEWTRFCRSQKLEIGLWAHNRDPGLQLSSWIKYQALHQLNHDKLKARMDDAIARCAIVSGAKGTEEYRLRSITQRYQLHEAILV